MLRNKQTQKETIKKHKYLINLIWLLSLCSETNKHRKRQFKNTNTEYKYTKKPQLSLLDNFGATSSTSSGYCHYAQKQTNTERDNSKIGIGLENFGLKKSQHWSRKIWSKKISVLVPKNVLVFHLFQDKK